MTTQASLPFTHPVTWNLARQFVFISTPYIPPHTYTHIQTCRWKAHPSLVGASSGCQIVDTDADWMIYLIIWHGHCHTHTNTRHSHTMQWVSNCCCPNSLPSSSVICVLCSCASCLRFMSPNGPHLTYYCTSSTGKKDWWRRKGSGRNCCEAKECWNWLCLFCVPWEEMEDSKYSLSSSERKVSALRVGMCHILLL